MADFRVAQTEVPFLPLPLLRVSEDGLTQEEEELHQASDSQISENILQRFAPLRELDAESRAELQHAAHLVWHREGDVFFHYGDCDEMEYFLVDGAVEMVAGDERVHTVQADAVIARQPLARLRPRQYTARAASKKTQLLQLDRLLLKKLQDNARQREQLCYSVEELTTLVLEPESVALMLFRNWRDEVWQRRRYLPAQPAVVADLRRHIKLGSNDMPELAKLVASAPALERCLLYAASSPLFGAQGLCTLGVEALEQLGLPTVSDLALAFVPVLIQVQQQHGDIDSLRHSMGVAAHAWWLAERTGLVEPCQALVMGLLHNTGMPWVREYLKMQQLLGLSPEEDEVVPPLLCRDVTGLLLARWEVEDIYTQALPLIYDWHIAGMNTRSGLADIVQAARYLQLRSEGRSALPPADHVNAVQRMGRCEQQLLDPCISKPAVARILCGLQRILTLA